MKEIQLSYLEAEIIIKAEQLGAGLSREERSILREVKSRFSDEPVWFWYALVETAMQVLLQTSSTLGPKKGPLFFRN